VGGCPSSRQNDAHGWYHHCLLRECARAWSAVLEPDPPPGTVAVLKVYITADGTFEEHSFTDRAGLVDILYRLRRAQSTRGIAPEREDTSRRLAEEQATSLREEQGDRPLMPGACPYELFREVEGVRTLLCDRAGWHSGRMARAIGVNWPPVRATAVQPAETAAEKKAYTAQLEAGVATAEAAVPRGMSNELVLLLGLAARLEHEDPAIVQPQIEAALATLGEARPSFEAVVEASLRRTMHAVRPDVKGGEKKAEPGEMLASGRISKGTVKGKSQGGESSHGGGGKRVGAGAKPGEELNKWKSLTKEKALALGLGWGACKKCGEKDKDGKDLMGAVSWNGSTRNPTRAARPSFVPTDMRFDRRHQCAACKCDFVVG